MPGDPHETSLESKNEGPSIRHPLGTDYLGRDLLQRTLHGLRTSLSIALGTIGLAFLVGCSLGCVSGYYGGRIDEFLARIIDISLAFPAIILALALAALIGPGISNLILVLALVQWASFARLMRGQVLSEKNQEYILSARAAGLPGWWIMLHHLVPNTIMPAVVLATMDIGHTLLTVSTLGFLGVGIPPSIPEWGSMINAGLNYMHTAPQNVLVPGMAITLVTLLFNIAGEELRDLIDEEREQGVIL
ncbi:MAG: ABC transporter permease [Methanolinea sp.]|nr:ABC transporter permease [Methanolinea sp.]